MNTFNTILVTNDSMQLFVNNCKNRFLIGIIFGTKNEISCKTWGENGSEIYILFVL